MSTPTDSTGRWSAAVPAGSYTVKFSVGYPVVFYAYDSHSADGAHVFQATSGGSVVVNDTVPLLGHVRGLVLDQSTGVPIEGVCASLIDPATYDPTVVPENQTAYPQGSGCTDATGHYAFTTFGVGSLAVQLVDPLGRYAGEYSGDARVLSRVQTRPMTEDGYAY